MAVHLTKIYTRTGDDGTTGLGDFSRVRKTDVRLAAYADVDECNAAIGVVLAAGLPADDVAAVLRAVQNDLFDVGADLCTPITDPDDSTPPEHPPLRITEVYVERLEAACDEFNAPLAKLDSFILPGGTPAAAYLHVARTVARRAERSVWALLEHDERSLRNEHQHERSLRNEHQHESEHRHAARTNPLTAKYLNRLSDLLFILGRVANPDGDVRWRPGGDHQSKGHQSNSHQNSGHRSESHQSGEEP